MHQSHAAEIGLKVVFFRLYLVHGRWYLIFAIKKMMFSVYGKNAIIALAYMLSIFNFVRNGSRLRHALWKV